MVEGLQDGYFLVKCDNFSFTKFLFGNDLDGYVMSIVGLVFSLEDLTETARAEHLLVDVILLLELMDTCAGTAAGLRRRE